ncbi:LegC family aminotransferase [Pedobacter caeni]|uniref:GDP-perosamine synthase n=1 Tax=Pedobacter caeni TaxID=288992 RepID=A0A1M5PQ21_9SPHI|nr:LegC family aminotransferase [Pedobacter caeni]SHH03770.1 aminotransferase, LLPSF_NHT_00031 family [Pedobacter caeni]
MSLNNFIPLSIPNLSGKELQYVTEALTDGWVSSVGPHVDKFEKEFAAYNGSSYAIACMNGTAAIHVSLIICGVKPNDEVLAPNLTFVAPLNAISYCGAFPVLLDSDWSTFGIDVDKLESFLKNETFEKDGFTYNKTSKRRIKAIIPMHSLGYSVEMDPLMLLCEKYNIDVIEDATESLGTEYKGKKTGNSGKLGCFSFNGNKIMTTGGGGMIVTNNSEYAKLAKHLTTTAKTDPIEYDHDSVGYNYRLVNVLAAIGLGQLEQMDDFVRIKRANLLKYKSKIDILDGLSIHTEPKNTTSNYWMYSLVLEKGYKHTVRQLVDIFSENKIQTRPIWKLMNSLPMYASCQSYHCDISLEIYNQVLSIPCSTSLTDADIDRVVNVLKSL